MAAAVFLAVFFVAGEGCMIWYLLRGIGEQPTLLRCMSYSFIGFFFSGITPSATGGQPMQLYYMRRDGNALSASSVVLMTVAGINWNWHRTVLEKAIKDISAWVFWIVFSGTAFKCCAGGGFADGNVFTGNHLELFLRD